MIDKFMLFEKHIFFNLNVKCVNLCSSNGNTV